MQSPHELMAYALTLAAKGRNTVSPNPMVGCVIVKDGQVIGEGYHQKAGEPHAEVHALQQAGEHVVGSTVYVTLEPCCHFGRTPPCVQALIAAKVKKVVIACLDANPLVAGDGVKALREAGIEVEMGILESEARALNEIFFHYITTKKPFVIAKWAMSLDGQTVTHVDDDRKITGKEAQIHTHALRESVDAILVGGETARRDNPLLTVRYTEASEVIQKQPLRIVLSRRGDLPLTLALFNSSQQAKTLVVTSSLASADWCAELERKQIEVMRLPLDDQDQIALPVLLAKLGERAITSLLVEGGMATHYGFMRGQLINKYIVYLANKIIGPYQEKKSLSSISMMQLGSDFCVMGYPAE